MTTTRDWHAVTCGLCGDTLRWTRSGVRTITRCGCPADEPVTLADVSPEYVTTLGRDGIVYAAERPVA